MDISVFALVVDTDWFGPAAKVRQFWSRKLESSNAKIKLFEDNHHRLGLHSGDRVGNSGLARIHWTQYSLAYGQGSGSLLPDDRVWIGATKPSRQIQLLNPSDCR